MKSKSTVNLKPLMWNEIDAEPEDRPRDIEEQVEMRRRKKTLADCELPDGFRLVTERPRQYWMLCRQMQWGFSLEYVDVVVRGNSSVETVTYTHVARYFPTISDEVQMRWALADFTRELMAENVKIGDVRRHLPMPLVQRGFKAVLNAQMRYMRFAS